MAPIAKEPDAFAAVQGSAGTVAQAGTKAQPAAAEIPVTVNGARTVEGSDKREPFSENTQTVLVFANGAVIRLASAVASGQLLFLTNEKTKKEVVCQVVKSKNYSSVSGYVELEFTEAAPGFWGMRFPAGVPATLGSGVAKPIASIATPTMKSLEEKLGEAKAKQPAAPASNLSKPTESKAVLVTGPTQPFAASPTPDLKKLHAAPVVPAQPPASASKIPTLSEFLTQSETGSSLKASEKQKEETGGRKPESGIQNPKLKSAPIQDQLSSKIFTQAPAQNSGPTKAVIEAPAAADTSNAARESEKKGSLSSLLIPSAAKENPAPGASTFDFGSDAVKIPAWLEPLARNSAISCAPQETKALGTAELEAKPFEMKTSEGKSSERLISGSESEELAELDKPSSGPAEEESEKQEAEFTLSSEGPTPNFGLSLAIDAKSADVENDSNGSSKGLKLGLLAAGLLLAAGGAWYWYSNQAKGVSANAGTTAQTNFGAPVAASASSTLPATVNSGSPDPALGKDANRNPMNAQPVRTDSKGSATSASNFSKPVGSAVNSVPTSLPAVLPAGEPATQPAIEPEKKPTLGKVHLRAPMLSRRASGPDNNAADSELAITGNGVAGSEAGSLNMLASKGNQPAAPVPIGGDVKQARLLSSVTPLYPQLARNQRLSGDVKVDALVDVNGRVSSMKVISGPALLQQAAMDALRQWKYQAATLNGQPMAMHLTVTVQFKLQ